MWQLYKAQMSMEAADKNIDIDKEFTSGLV
jgi:hypothetical protein